MLALGGCGSGGKTSHPSANAGPDQTVGSGASVTLDGGASSGTGTLSYAWLQTGGTTVTLSSTAETRPSFTAPLVIADETLTFRLKITD